jgi:microcystin-dependent protein
VSSPYIGEIRMFGGNFAPVGWMFCQGQTLPISEYDTLFNLIGTTYGGDGQETFNLPDLQGRIPIHSGQLNGGQTYQIGEKSGVETVTLTAQQIPIHNHALVASGHIADQGSPANNVPAQSSVADLYIEAVPNSSMAANAVGPAGGSQPHDNMPPFLCVNFIISLYGVFPSQT